MNTRLRGNKIRIPFRWAVAALIAPILATAPWFALAAFGQQSTGRIEGRVVRDDGSGVGGVSVVLNELSFTDITEASGTFHFSSVPTGSYTITFTLGETARTLIGVTVAAGATTQIEEPANWTDGFAETLTVQAASRRIERIVEAPAAVTSVPEAEIEGKASTGQLPKLLEFAPGVEVTQSGLYDYNVNTRGFNSSLNRRVATLVDGRDPSIPFLGSQEWAAISFPLDDIATLELYEAECRALWPQRLQRRDRHHDQTATLQPRRIGPLHDGGAWHRQPRRPMGRWPRRRLVREGTGRPAQQPGLFGLAAGCCGIFGTLRRHSARGLPAAGGCGAGT